MMVIRDGDRVRLLSRGRNDYTKRFPWIVEAALKRRHKQFIIDGEAVLLNSTAFPISTACVPASTTVGCSSTPSTSWRWTAMT